MRSASEGRRTWRNAVSIEWRPHPIRAGPRSLTHLVLTMRPWCRGGADDEIDAGKTRLLVVDALTWTRGVAVDLPARFSGS